MDDRSDDHDIEVEGGIHAYERKISGILDDGSVGFQQPLLARNRKNTTSQIAIVGANTCPIESLDYEYVFVFPNFTFLLFWKTETINEIRLLGRVAFCRVMYFLCIVLHFFSIHWSKTEAF